MPKTLRRRKTLNGRMMSIRGRVRFLRANVANGDAKSRIILLANTGRPMDLEGFPHKVIIDMRGARFDKSATTPVIVDHKTNMRFGHTTAQMILRAGEKGKLESRSVVGPLIAASAIRSSKMEVAKGIEVDAREGFPFQVSVGATIIKGYMLEDGEEAEINGRVWSGPLIVASKSLVRELSITVLGADSDTSALIAAKALLRESTMTFRSWVKNLGLMASLKDPKTAKRLEAEFNRIQKLRANKTRKKVLAGAGDPDDEEDDDDKTETEEEGGSKGRRRVKAKGKFRAQSSGHEGKRFRDMEGDLINAHTRIEAIGDLTKEFEGTVESIEIKDREYTLKEFKAYALRKRMSPEQYELQLRRAQLPDSSDRAPAIHAKTSDINPKALEVAILRATGTAESGFNKVNEKAYGLEAMYDEKVLEASWERKYQIGTSINRLFALQVAAAGGHVSHLTSDHELFDAALAGWTKVQAMQSRQPNIQASGFSTLNLTNIFENVAHKSALAAFDSVETVWRQFTGIMTLGDFKTHSLYKLDWEGQFRKVATDGELKHLSMKDSKKTISLETYGAMITIDRKTRIDDDLNMVLAKARGIGLLGAQRIEEAVFVLLLSNPGSFFHANNNNLLTGASSVLGIDALTTAEQKFRDQVVNGKPVNNGPSILLAGSNQVILGNRLYKKTQLSATGDTDALVFTDNPHAGKFLPVYSGYLNNTNITDQDGKAITGQSTTQWYLFSNPNAAQGSAIVIGFLNGRQVPFFDEADTQFNIPGGLQIRSYFDFGLAMHMTEMALKSAGA